MIEVQLRNASDGQGRTGIVPGQVTARYMRRGAASNVPISVVAATLGTYTSGGWVEVDPVNQRGVYQFGVPAGAFAIGADAVTITFQVSGAIDKAVNIALDRRVASRESEADAATRQTALITEHDATQIAVAAVQADTDDIQTRLPAALVGGRMDASVGAMATDVVTASAIATDAIGAAELAASAVAELQAGLALEATAQAIKAKTDNLPSDPADESLLEAAISTRAAPGDAMTLTVAERAAIQAELEEDGASILDTLRDRLTAARALLLDNLSLLDAAISSRAPASTALSTVQWTNARAALLDALALLDVAVSTRESESNAAARALTDQAEHGDTQAMIAGLPGAPSEAAIAAAVWAAATRTLTSVAAVMDTQGYTAARAALLANLDATVGSRATPAQVAAELAAYDGATGTEAAAIQAAVNRMLEDLEHRLKLSTTTGRWELYNAAGTAIIRSWPALDVNGAPITNLSTIIAERGVVIQ